MAGKPRKPPTAAVEAFLRTLRRDIRVELLLLDNAIEDDLRGEFSTTLLAPQVLDKGTLSEDDYKAAQCLHAEQRRAALAAWADALKSLEPLVRLAVSNAGKDQLPVEHLDAAEFLNIAKDVKNARV